MSEITIEIGNIGGIDEMSVCFEEGVTLIEGPNAANKTSLLQGVLFALGSSTVPIKSGADSAYARLTIRDETIERTAQRTKQGVRTGGDMWVDDADEQLLLDRFAALLGPNPLRSAVSRNQDIEPLLKEPMNIDTLEEKRAQKMQEKREINRQLQELEGIDTRLAEHERKIEEKQARLAELESTLEDLEDERAESEEDEHLSNLREQRARLRSEQDECLNQIERLEDAITKLEDRLESVAEDIEDAERQSSGTNIEALKQKRADIQSELDEIKTRRDILQSVLTANREMLNSDFTGILGYDAGLLDDELTCWACGQSTNQADIKDTVAELQELIEQDKTRLQEREPELADIETQIRDAEEARSRHQALVSKRNEIEQQIEERRDSLSQQRIRLQEVRDELERIDEEIAAYEADRANEGASEVEQIESTRVEIRTLRREIERLESTRADLREKQDQRTQKQQRIEELTADINSLTDRIENIEGEVREVFNETMDELIAALDFERIERVWLDGNFDLIIAREVDGSVRTDTIEHLAESEREMIGLVLGLAGFVTFEVDEISPILVLDSLGMFDAERTQQLISYFADRTEILLAAVHPETARESKFQSVTFEAGETLEGVEAEGDV